MVSIDRLTGNDSPRISYVVPSLDGDRGGAVARLRASIAKQTEQDAEVILVVGLAPQGRAVNVGASAARGRFLVIVDDDAELASPNTVASLVAALETDSRIGMAGASIVLSPDASAFQRRAAQQFPRLHTPRVEQITDSDLACHGCCAFRREVFEAVGREREDIVRGLDPDLRERIRGAGYRVVLVPGAAIYHPLPDGMRALARTFFRNGFGSAYAQRFQPEAVYDTHESLHERGFRARTPLVYRALRFPGRLALALARGQSLRFSAYTVYLAGYAWGWFTATPIAPAAAPPAHEETA